MLIMLQLSINDNNIKVKNIVIVILSVLTATGVRKIIDFFGSILILLCVNHTILRIPL